MRVLPGDYVGASEEYLPSFGTYEEDESLFASNAGDLVLDPKDHSAKVVTSTRTPKLQGIGTIVVGIAAEVSDQNAIIDLTVIPSKKIVLVRRGASAMLHVSRVRRGFVESLRDEVRVGDIIRAKIVEVSARAVELTVDDKFLGVIKAFCSNCRHELKKQGPDLACDNCGNREQRKTAFDYASGKLL